MSIIKLDKNYPEWYIKNKGNNLLSGGNNSDHYTGNRLCTTDITGIGEWETAYGKGYLSAGITSSTVCLQNSQKIRAIRTGAN